jgi:hypothetical protein
MKLRDVNNIRKIFENLLNQVDLECCVMDTNFKNSKEYIEYIEPIESIISKQSDKFFKDYVHDAEVIRNNSDTDYKPGY